MKLKTVGQTGCLLIMALTVCLGRPDCLDVVCVSGHDCPGCPQLTGCRNKADGKYYFDGERIPDIDPCRVCTCRRGIMECDYMACLAVYCEGEYSDPGVCCPVCPPNNGQLMR